MNGPRFRITVLQMMVLLGGLAATLGAFRVHAILGVCVAFVTVLGGYRAVAIGDRCRDAGKPLRAWESIGVFCCSILVAFTILNVSLLITVATHRMIDPSTAQDGYAEPNLVLQSIDALARRGAVATCLGSFAAIVLGSLLWPSRWADCRLANLPRR